MGWLNDLFYLIAFVVTVSLVTLSVYQGEEAYPTVATTEIVATTEHPEREMPEQAEIIPTVAVVLPKETR